MSVFTFKRVVSYKELDANGLPDRNESCSAFAHPEPKCSICRARLEDGQKAMSWQFADNGDDLLVHATCIGKHATGMIKDLADCQRIFFRG